MHHSQITETFIRQLEKSTGLIYEPSSSDSSVCFANQNNDLLDDYKISFTREDVYHYLLAFPDNDLPDTTTFWKGVRIGKNKI